MTEDTTDTLFWTGNKLNHANVYIYLELLATYWDQNGTLDPEVMDLFEEENLFVFSDTTTNFDLHEVESYKSYVARTGTQSGHYIYLIWS